MTNYIVSLHGSFVKAFTTLKDAEMFVADSGWKAPYLVITKSDVSGV